MTAGKTVSSTRAETSQVMTPDSANLVGKVFGGTILGLIDLCAYVSASRFAGGICVTASFDRVDFHEPINVGELVTLIGHVTYVGRTSLEMTIEIYAERLFTGQKRHTNTARVTMVHLDENLKPKEVPRLICETKEDKVRFLQGRLRRELRARRAQESERLSHRFESATYEELDRLMAADSLLDG
ncbi:MAG TPA: acyl-CoA thioesterase [Fimbriimonadaceae bacterium]|nr:acyl-CoA thioesterase [Fimbriimonadaceae bacterium]